MLLVYFTLAIVLRIEAARLISAGNVGPEPVDNQIDINICDLTVNRSSNYYYERTIKVDEGKIIQLNLEQIWISNNKRISCNGEELRIYDSDLSLIKEICGKRENINFYSSGNQLTLVFMSFGSSLGCNYPFRGFKANYRAINPSDEPRVRKFQNCGGSINTSSGVIKSPNFPDKYPNNAECVWNVELPNEKGRIGLREDYIRKVSFFFEPNFDKLIMLDPLSSDNETVTLNSLPLGNRLQVIFTSDGSVAGNGFEIIFQDVSNCGGELNANSGWTVINSPNYGNPVPPLMDCKWLINVPHDSSLAMTIYKSPSQFFHCGDSTLMLKSSGHRDIDLCSKFEYRDTLNIKDPADQIEMVMHSDKYDLMQFSIKFKAYGK